MHGNLRAVVLSAAIILGCSPRPGAGAPPVRAYSSIGEAASRTPEVSTFVERAKRVPGFESLATHGPYTAFVPSNRALESVKGGQEASFWHHVARGLYLPEDLHDGQVLRQMDGKPLQISKENGRLYADGVLLPDPIRTGNGALYVLDQALSRK